MGIRLGVAAVVLLALGASARGDSDADALARFESEYPAASKRLEDLFGQVKGSCSLWTGQPGESKPTRTNEASFALDHGHEKVSIGSKLAARASTESVYCVGPDSVFYLTRDPGAKGYLVEGTGATALDRSAYVTLFGRFVKAHFASFGQPLTLLMTKPGFRVVGAQFVRAKPDEHPLIKVDFESGAKVPKSNISVVFDPDAGWIIRSSEFRIDGPSRMRITTDVEYGPARDGVLLPRRVTCRDAGGEASICEFRDWVFEPTPEEEFKMTHYGLPKLVAKTGAARSSLPYWHGGIGAATLSAAALLRRRATRTRLSLA